MKKKKSANSAIDLRSRIEREKTEPSRNSDSVLGEVEEFIPGLLHEISQGLHLPKTDLRTQESASQATIELGSKLQELREFQHRVRSLKGLLKEKRHALRLSGEKSSEDFLSLKTNEDID